MQTGLHQQKNVQINASPEQMPNNIVPAKERKFIVFESKLNELFSKGMLCLWGERENDKTAHYWYCNFSCYKLQLQSAI